MENGYEGYEADITDFELHANLYFPEVRMRNFLEIRNHDCVGNDLQYSIMAIYKGILYNKIAINDIEELFAQFSSENFSELRYNVPKNAMNTKIGKYFVKDFAKEILYIAEKALIEANTGEEKFLEPIKEYTLSGICPADIILRNWNGVWNKNIQKLVEFVS
jgi:glutamate--cysteine ligase